MMARSPDLSIQDLIVQVIRQRRLSFSDMKQQPRQFDWNTVGKKQRKTLKRRKSN